MEKAITTITLDLQKGGTQAVVYAKDSDANSRVIRILLANNGKPYDADGLEAVVLGVKPDGNKIYNFCEVKDGAIHYGVTAQTVAKKGNVECELRLYGVEASLDSPKFRIVVEKALFKDDEVESTNEFTELTKQIETVGVAIAEVGLMDKRIAATETEEDIKALCVKDGEEYYFCWLNDDLVLADETLLWGMVYGASKSGDEYTVRLIGSLQGERGEKGDQGERGERGTDGASGADGKSAYEYAKEGGYAGSEAEFTAKLGEGSYASDIATMKSQIADLMYDPIDITKFTNTVNTTEIGSTVNTVTLNWTINKKPVELLLDGEVVNGNAGNSQKTIENAGLRSNKTFTLTAKDERGAIDTATTSISFLRGVYYGVYAQGDTIDDDFILTLTPKLQSGKAITFTANAASGEQIAFALPQSYGTPSFNVGGFDGGFHLEKTFEFTNASGHTETYCVWLSDNAGLGNTTVKVN